MVQSSETARKALNRLRICIQHAAALGLDVDLQAPDKAKALLGKPRHTVAHIPAMAWEEVPEFYQSLDEETVTHMALRLLILTGVRSGPLRNLQENQLSADIWTIPAEGMKGRKDATSNFRIPLVSEAQNVLAMARRHSRNGFLFPSIRRGVISDATMSRLMERRGLSALMLTSTLKLAKANVASLVERKARFAVLFRNNDRGSIQKTGSVIHRHLGRKDQLKI